MVDTNGMWWRLFKPEKVKCSGDEQTPGVAQGCVIPSDVRDLLARDGVVAAGI